MTFADHFDVEPGYLDAATSGVPCRATVEVMTTALAEWSAGRFRAKDCDGEVARTRGAMASLLDAPVADVAVGPQVAVFVGMVATSLAQRRWVAPNRGGAADAARPLRVVVPQGDFTSVTFPFQARESDGLVVDHVPLAALAEAVDERTDLVAWSAVQSADGAVADNDAVLAAARRAGALTLCDLTQAAGWLPLSAACADVTVTGGYKWLAHPRGTAFLTAPAAVREALLPSHANWYAGESVWDSVYGPTMQLAQDARRFDVSPAWLLWVGAAPVAELFAGLNVADVRRHDLELAAALRDGLGLPGQEGSLASAVVSVADPTGVLAEKAAVAGCRVSSRAGRLRIAPHLWNDLADVELLLAALR